MAREQAREQVEAYPDPGLGIGLRATIAELGRVVWPTRQELFRMTGVVVAFVVGISVFIAAVDLVLNLLFNNLYGIK
jgi:preprotein translocase SecE subunit